MRSFSRIYKQCLLAIIFAILFIPFIQNKFKIFEILPLHGDISIAEDAYLNNTGWFSGVYQEKQETHLNSAFGFRELVVRLHNQLKFSVFNLPTAKGVVIGKENYFYEENYIKAYTGVDFIGEDSIDKIVSRINFISDTLSKLNKQLIIVFAAGKASYYPEYIPNNYLPVKGKTNYKILSTGIKNTSVNYIDFNEWFVAQKAISKYPLYPQYGIHWSNYGAVLAADSIIKKIEFLRKIDMPNLIYNEVELKPSFGIDYDIADGMNLLVKLRSIDMAYPKIKTEPAENKIKPSVLVVSDSFYWGMYDFGIANSFGNNHFWYYNKQVYPETFKNELFVEDLDIKTEIIKHEVFIVMATEANLSNIGWGFFEKMERNFKGVINLKNTTNHINDLKKKILEDKKWMEDINKKAIKKNISVDSMLTLDAMWIIEHPD
ncbi:MAG: hypothetical protein Q7W45_06170 [Bacteroidota bacterium]|nr:hypothetical protein [Bacteroidota bacterium]MDP3145034.1 hypothetical protein [Bacteroidota bacterium]